MIEHQAYMTAEQYQDDKAIEKWLEMVRIARKENVFLGLSAYEFFNW